MAISLAGQASRNYRVTNTDRKVDRLSARSEPLARLGTFKVEPHDCGSAKGIVKLTVV